MKSGQCPKCNATDILVAHPGEYGGDSMEVGPMSVTAKPRWILGGRDPRESIGAMVLYVCRSCGFAEWYVTNPKSVPIGQDYQTEILRPGDDQPIEADGA